MASKPGPEPKGSDGNVFTTPEAAAFLGVRPRTLEDWRVYGGGPVYRKVGRHLVRYLRADLEAFLEKGAKTNTGQP